MTQTLSLAVQPPTHAQKDVPLYPPMAVSLSSEMIRFEQLSEVLAVVTLVQLSGEVLHDKLGGKLIDSAHPLTQTTNGIGSSSNDTSLTRAYFYFPDLVIHEAGQYRLRVSLMQMDYSDKSSYGVVKVCGEVNSRCVTVQDSEVSYSQPSSPERAFLQVLEDDGQDIPDRPA